MRTDVLRLSHAYVTGLPDLLSKSIFNDHSRLVLNQAVDAYRQGYFNEHDVAGLHWTQLADDFFSTRHVPFGKVRLSRGKLQPVAGEIPEDLWKEALFPGVRARLLYFENDISRLLPLADRETPLEFHLVNHEKFPDEFAEDRNLFMLYYFIFQPDWDLPEDFFFPDAERNWILLPSYAFFRTALRMHRPDAPDFMPVAGELPLWSMGASQMINRRIVGFPTQIESFDGTFDRHPFLFTLHDVFHAGLESRVPMDLRAFGGRILYELTRRFDDEILDDINILAQRNSGALNISLARLLFDTEYESVSQITEALSQARPRLVTK